jgi:hypothetical protein
LTKAKTKSSKLKLKYYAYIAEKTWEGKGLQYAPAERSESLEGMHIEKCNNKNFFQILKFKYIFDFLCNIENIPERLRASSKLKFFTKNVFIKNAQPKSIISFLLKHGINYNKKRKQKRKKNL